MTMFYESFDPDKFSVNAAVLLEKEMFKCLHDKLRDDFQFTGTEEDGGHVLKGPLGRSMLDYLRENIFRRLAYREDCIRILKQFDVEYAELPDEELQESARIASAFECEQDTSMCGKLEKQTRAALTEIVRSQIDEILSREDNRRMVVAILNKDHQEEVNRAIALEILTRRGGPSLE